VWQFMAAACALIAIATSAWGYQQHRALNRSKTTASSAYSVLSERDATATSGAIGTSGNATLVYSKSTGHMVLVAHGIRAAAQGKTYQLWTISPSGTATSAGLFTPNGSGDVLVRASGDLANASKLGISVEPAGGSAQPTPGAIIVTMNL